MQGQPAADTEAPTRRRRQGAAEDPTSGETQRLSVLAELEQRIHELESMQEERFGRFTRLDWALCAAGSLLLPYLCYLWFWP